MASYRKISGGDIRPLFCGPTRFVLRTSTSAKTSYCVSATRRPRGKYRQVSVLLQTPSARPEKGSKRVWHKLQYWILQRHGCVVHLGMWYRNTAVSPCWIAVSMAAQLHRNKKYIQDTETWAINSCHFSIAARLFVCSCPFRKDIYQTNARNLVSFYTTPHRYEISPPSPPSNPPSHFLDLRMLHSPPPLGTKSGREQGGKKAGR